LSFSIVSIKYLYDWVNYKLDPSSIQAYQKRKAFFTRREKT